MDNSSPLDQVASYIEFWVNDYSAPIQDFDWRMSQAMWATIVERSFKNGTSLAAERYDGEQLLFGAQKTSVKPILDGCCLCANMLTDVFQENDNAGEAIIYLSRQTSERKKVFFYLAMGLYNGMLAAKNEPMAQTLVLKGYHSVANCYNKNGNIPQLNQAQAKAEIQQTVQQISKSQKGCLVPLMAFLATTIAAGSAVFLFLS